jgi:hypothetical protein
MANHHDEIAPVRRSNRMEPRRVRARSLRQVKGSRTRVNTPTMRFRSATPAALFFAVLLLAGCGGVDGGSSINAKDVGPCPPGKQISGRQLRAILRTEGFSAVCLKDVPYGQIANLSPTGQGHRAEREGSVICTASESMPPRTALHPHKVFEWGSLSTDSQPGRELLLANIRCSLYLDPDTRQDAPARIRKAFNALAARRY